MKTSVIEVHNMLSVLSMNEVGKRIGKVPAIPHPDKNAAV